jgi:hypothetical protein
VALAIGAHAKKGQRGVKGTRICCQCRVIHVPQPKHNGTTEGGSRRSYYCSACVAYNLWWCPGCNKSWQASRGQRHNNLMTVTSWCHLVAVAGGIPKPFMMDIPRIPRIGQVPGHMTRICNVCAAGHPVCFICSRHAHVTTTMDLLVRQGASVYLTPCQLCGPCAARPHEWSSCIRCQAVGIRTSNLRFNDDLNGYVCGYCRVTQYQPAHKTTFKVNGSRRTVGYELEFFVPQRTALAMGPWGRIHGDGSIRPPMGCDGNEFASHPFNGDHLFKTMQDSTSYLKGKKAEVNASCGMHMHFGATDQTPEQQRNIMEWWPVLEPLFAGMVDSRRRSNEYCQMVSKARNQYDRYSSRYKALNTEALGEHGTFEVRLHHGTLDADELVGWAQTMLGFFDKFCSVEAKQKLLDVAKGLSPRGLLMFFLQKAELPLRVRKHCIQRFMKYGLGTTGYDMTYLDKKGREVLHLEEVS